MKIAIKHWLHVNLFAMLIVVLLGGFDAYAKDHELILASTTSTENSGLFAHILPIFEANSQIKIRVIAVGTCLLYTSPSPRDRSLSRMPSSA